MGNASATMTAVRGRRRRAAACAVLAVVVLLPGCTGSTGDTASSSPATRSTHPRSTTSAVPSSTSSSSAVSSAAASSDGSVTVAFAGDVHFSGRVRARLDRNPATVFAQAAPGLRRADLTMVNLETAVTSGGTQQAKEFTFRAPAKALGALRDAGIDVATMANNHGADYGTSGLRDSLAAAQAQHFPIVGIGEDAAAAFTPYRTTIRGTRLAIFAADQVQDETTLRLFSAGAHSPGVANAFSDRLVSAVRAAHAAGYVVIVYVHWGIEFHTCPSSLQTGLAARLADAGAAAIVGTHAHVLQGAGWRKDGTYVAYGLGNYLWWMSFGNDQDDNGVLTLTLRHGRVVNDAFAPSHLDARGVPVPATGAEATRIQTELATDRQCADLAARPPH